MVVKKRMMSSKSNNNKKKWFIIIMLVVFLGGGYLFFFQKEDKVNYTLEYNEKKENIIKEQSELKKEDVLLQKELKKENKAEDIGTIPKVGIYGKNKGKVAIVIDDFGYNKEVIEKFANIKKPLTFAVLPFKSYSKEAVSKAKASNHEAILHLPMETLEGTSSETGAIMTSLDEKEIKSRMQKMFDNLPGIVGVNNHQGSKATTDKKIMKVVLTQIKEKDLFFLDSRTNQDTIAGGMAKKLKVPTATNALFLDNKNDVELIKKQLKEAIRLSLQKGDVVVIGHARENTAIAIQEMLGEFEKNGVILTNLSSLTE